VNRAVSAAWQPCGRGRSAGRCPPAPPAGSARPAPARRRSPRSRVRSDGLPHRTRTSRIAQRRCDSPGRSRPRRSPSSVRLDARRRRRADRQRSARRARGGGHLVTGGAGLACATRGLVQRGWRARPHRRPCLAPGDTDRARRRGEDGDRGRRRGHRDLRSETPTCADARRSGQLVAAHLRRGANRRRHDNEPPARPRARGHVPSGSSGQRAKVPGLHSPSLGAARSCGLLVKPTPRVG